MIDLKTGSFQALEAALIADVGRLRLDDPLSGILVVIPTGRVRTRLQQQLVLKHAGLLQIDFLTPFGLAERILQDGSVHDDRVVGGSALYQEIIRGFLDGSSEEAFTLKQDLMGPERTITRGLPGALASTLKDLRDSGARVTDAMKAALEGHLGPEAGGAAPTLELYARVYSTLQKNHLRTPSDVLRRAANHASRSAFLKNKKAIFLYGFYDFTGVQLDLILALSNHPDARVYFPYEEGDPAYAYAEKLLNDPVFTTKYSAASTQRLKTDTAPTHLTLSSCSGSHDEVWFTAKQILRLLDEVVAPSDIAVIARRLDPYLSAIRDLFAGHQIPYAASKGEPAGAHPWVKSVRGLVRQSLEPKQGSWTDHMAWIQSLVDTCPAQTSVERDLQQAVLGSIKDLAVLDVLHKPVSRQHAVALWEEKLDGLERPPADAAAGVQVLEVQHARGLRFKAVFLLGLNEKSFPRLIREDPFLSDAARSALAQALGCRLGRKMDGYPEERLLFALMLQTAERYAYLLWQRSDEEGKALIPSIYVQELLRSRKLKAARLPRALPDKLRDQAAAALTPKELSYLINRAGAAPDTLYEALGWNTAQFKALLRAHQAIESFRPGILRQDGLVEKGASLQKALAKGFSPSGLEDLAACPYQYFAGHILRLPVPENPAPHGQIAPDAMGKLFHSVLEQYFKNNDLSAACDQAFDRFGQDYPGIYPLVLKASRTIVFKHLSKFIESDTEDRKDSGFEPAFFEQEMEGSIPELGPALARYPFRGRADRIDLKKENGGWIARVLDYKSGRARPSKKLETALIQGKFLQLPIYLSLAQSYLATVRKEAGHVESSALRWLRIEDQGEPETAFPDSFWKGEHAKTFTDNMKGLIEIAENGHFYIEPNTGDWGHCTYCGYAKICRKEHMPTRARAAEDPVRLANRERLSRSAKDTAS